MENPTAPPPSTLPAPVPPPSAAALPSIPLPPWDMYTVAVGLFSGYILVPLLASNVLTLVDPFMSNAHQMFIQQVVTLLTWALIFGVLAWKHRVNIWSYLGVQFNRPPIYYILQALYLVAVMMGLILLLNVWVKSSGLNPQQPYENYSSGELRAIAFFAVLTAPVLEELVFRGFVQSAFHKVHNLASPVRSVVFTTLTFLLFHGSYFDNVQALTYVLVLGLVLGYWRERTQSIIPGILGHLVNNIMASVTMLFS